MQIVAGLFDTEEKADLAIKALEEGGFNQNHLGLVAREGFIEKVDRQTDLEQGSIQAESKLGASGGAALGGLAGLLAGLSALVVPGIGPVVAAGSLATALGTTTATTGLGAAAGGLLGALTSMGISEEEAGVYAEGVKRGGILTAVETYDARAPLVADIMKKAGAIEIKTVREEWEATGWRNFDESQLPEENYPGLSP